jgi:hypothetical protein
MRLAVVGVSLGLALVACREPKPSAARDSWAPAVRVAAKAEIRFAVIGDYGRSGPPAHDVARLVAAWRPDVVITTGDNKYPRGAATTIDDNVGRYYHRFLSPYRGAYGDGAYRNRFFPTLGNHDLSTGGGRPYFDYFALPGNERYYDVVAVGGARSVAAPREQACSGLPGIAQRPGAQPPHLSGGEHRVGRGSGEAPQHPIEEIRQPRIRQRRLRHAGHPHQIVAPALAADDDADPGERGHPCRARAVELVTAGAVQHVVVRRRRRGRGRPPGRGQHRRHHRDRRRDEAYSPALPRPHCSGCASSARPMISAVEQL